MFDRCLKGSSCSAKSLTPKCANSILILILSITFPYLTSNMCHCLPSLLLFSFCSPTCPAQVLARRLSPDSWDGESSVSVIPGADLRTVPGQVCGVRQDERRRGGSPALLLHDRRQGGQDPGAAGELWGGGAEQRHRGAARRRNRSGRRASDNPSTSVILSSVFFFCLPLTGSRGQTYPCGLLRQSVPSHQKWAAVGL